MADKGTITPRQVAAISALLTEESVGKAARKAKVGERTLARWLAEDVAFQAELHKAQDKAIDAAVSLLSGEARAAAATLQEIHKNREVNPAVRVQAARAILIENLKVREQRDIVARIEALEQRLQQ